MKSKKTKSNSSTPRTFEDELPSNQSRGNAFSFLKNRLFQSGSNNNTTTTTSNNNAGGSKASSSSKSPRTSTSSTRINNQPISIEKETLSINTIPLSKSFEELQPVSDFHNDNNSNNNTSNNNSKNGRPARPVSMMGMEGLSLMQFDSSRKRNSTSEKRTSLIIIKEGYLFKKTDFKPFHKQTKLDRGWKLYKVILRGHKLYLYKVASESPLRSLFPSPKELTFHSSVTSNVGSTTTTAAAVTTGKITESSLPIITTTAATATTPVNIKPVKSDFDRQAQETIFSSKQTIQAAAIFMELNQVTMQAVQEVHLVTTQDGFLYVCNRPESTKQQLWKIESKLPIDHLKLDFIEYTDTPNSPNSLFSSSSFSDDIVRHLHSNGHLLFNLSYSNRPSIFGVYSTQYRDIGQAWVSSFQSQAESIKNGKRSRRRGRHQHSPLEEDLPSSSRSGGSTSHEDWDDSMNGRMYDATQKGLDLIRKGRAGSDGIIQGGTLEALILELLSSPSPSSPSSSSLPNNSNNNNNNNEDNAEFIDVFLTTYSTFTTGSHLMTILASYIAEKPERTERLLDLFMVWCERFGLDVMGDVATRMISILDKISTERALAVKKVVLDTVTENSKLLTPSESDHHHVENKIAGYDVVEGKRCRDSVNLSQLLITGLTPDVFLIIDPTGFAEQIYIFHLSQHLQYQQIIFNSLSYLSKPQSPVQMLNSLLFTSASPHFLTKMIRSHILIDSQQQEQKVGLLIRSQLLEHWIQVGLQLMELGDMTGWCAVAMGVCSVGIARLRETWKAVDRNLVKIVQDEWAKILADHGLFNQNKWSDEWSADITFKCSQVLDADELNLRQQNTGNNSSTATVVTTSTTLSLPFFGTIRQTVDCLKRRIHRSLGPTFINFDECRLIHDTIKSSLNHWSNISAGRPSLTKSSIEFPVVGPLQSFFEHCVTDLASVPHDFKYLQECSIACEPKIFGQGYDRRKFSSHHHQQSGSDVSPPSSSSLVFPELLRSYHLHDLICIIIDSSSSSSDTGIKNSDQGSSASIKTHPRKRGNNNSIRSLRSFLEDDQSGKSSLSKKNLRSLQYLPISSSSSYTSLLNGSSSASSPTTMDVVGASNSTTTSSPPSPPPPSKSASRKAFRRRTYSFPSGNQNTPSGKNDISSDHTRTWLGSLISNRYHRTYSTKTLIDTHRRNKSYAGNSGEIILSVQQGELIFKVSALLARDKPEEKESTEENQFTLLVHVKGGYLEYLVELLVYGIEQYTDALKEQWNMISLTEDLQQVVPENITLDDEEYINTFFVTYRIFCSSTHLLDMLQKKFVNAKTNSTLATKKKNSLILLESYFQTPNSSNSSSSSTNSVSEQKENLSGYDWKKIASVQLRVLDILLYWTEEYFYDFIDEMEIHRYIQVFLHKAKEALNDWLVPLESLSLDESDELRPIISDALAIAKLIKDRMNELQKQFLVKSLSPCYDIRAIEFDPEGSRGAEELYQQLTSGDLKYHTTLQLATNRMIPFRISKKPRDSDAGNVVDRYPAEYLLEQVDKSVRQLFVSVTMQDWIQTFDVFEAQSGDIYAWLPARKPSRTSKISASLSCLTDTPSNYLQGNHILQDEVIVSDIFTAIESAKRSVVSPSAFSDDDLLLAFPGAIQYLYCMHFIIRSWVIHDISSTAIDLKTRVLRIEKFLQIIMASRASGETVVLSPELKDDHGSKKRIPGFVEYAISSALVSPEVRIFTKAWNDVAMQHDHANLDTLENLLHQIQKAQSRTPSKKEIKEESKPNLIVPSLGWIFERILELCVGVPDTFENRDNVINFDKRRCVFHFLQLIMDAQIDLHEQKVEQKSISMSFLISPNPESTSWKDLREAAARETKKSSGNSTSGSLVMRGPSYKSHVSRTSIFGKLVTEQMDKMKRDFKERDRVDKEWLSLQYKLQKKQLEHARQSEKNDKKAHMAAVTKHGQHHGAHHSSMMPRINSFLRGLRPQSMVVSPIQHMFPSIHTDANFTTLKASTVINLIHSTTSVASTYTKREFVFRIVTEEGGQYLFQGMSREDMYDWMQQINNAAREGAAKRQSVLAAESMIDDPSAQNIIVNDESRIQPPRTRSSVYGVTLDCLMRDGKMPAVVDKCIREIEKRGLEEVGIYRVAGTGSVVSALKAEFNKNVDKVDLSDPAWADINVVADAFKQFLRELPEPLLTYAYYDEFINASASEDHDERVYLIKKVLGKLPYNNYVLLKRIIEHFVIVTDFEATNHMYATNLAIVFGPTLLQPAPGPASFATTMSNLGHHQNIVKYLILNYHYLFDVESDEVDTMKEEEEDLK